MVRIVRELEAGATGAEVTRRHGISRETLRRWRARFQDMGVAEARRLKQLEDEDRRLTTLVAELSLDNALRKDVLGRTW